MLEFVVVVARIEPGSSDLNWRLAFMSLLRKESRTRWVWLTSIYSKWVLCCCVVFSVARRVEEDCPSLALSLMAWICSVIAQLLCAVVAASLPIISISFAVWTWNVFVELFFFWVFRVWHWFGCRSLLNCDSCVVGLVLVVCWGNIAWHADEMMQFGKQWHKTEESTAWWDVQAVW